MSYLGRQLNVPASTTELTAAVALSAGNAVLINSNGKVTKPGSTLGSALTVISSNVNFVESVFDSTNNKVVVACTDQGNSDVGKAFVVSVSGTTCTAGSVVQFSSGGADNISITFDSSNGKVVICYRDKNNTNYGTAIVGTVSGTSISFGTATVFESANTTDIGTTFDSSNNKVVVGYRDVGNSGHGTARVLTVSGTSISDGGAVVFEAASTKECSLVFDSSNNKVVIAYEDAAVGDHGTAIVGTVSGTSISFGSPAVFEAAQTRDTNATFDSTNNKVLIVYADENNSNYGTAVVGTVSGTSISFGTPVVYTGTEVGYFPSGSFNPDTGKVGVFVYSSDADFYEATISGTSVSFSGITEIDSDVPGGEHTVVYDTNADVYVFVYPDSGNSNYATVVALDPGPALTSENFIGFAEEDATANGLATIQLGGSVNDKQTSLTAGQTYFVQTDGTIGLTADSPSVTAGTAVSSTKILVKG
jgi:hypothetical protein